MTVINELTSLAKRFSEAHPTRQVDLGSLLAFAAEEEAKYVQVSFGSSRGEPYVYECKGCAVGDWIVVPPNVLSYEPQLVKVVATGRNGYEGKIIKAHRVPKAFSKRGKR